MNIFQRIINYLKKNPSEIKALVGEGVNYIDLLYATPWRLVSVFLTNAFNTIRETPVGPMNVGVLITLGYIPVFVFGFLTCFHKIEIQKFTQKDVDNFKALCRLLLKINPADQDANHFLANLTRLEALTETVASKTIELNNGNNTKTTDIKISTLEAEIKQLKVEITNLKNNIVKQAKVFVGSITLELEEEGMLPYNLNVTADKNALPRLTIPGLNEHEHKASQSINSLSTYEDDVEILLVNKRSQKQLLPGVVEYRTSAHNHNNQNNIALQSFEEMQSGTDNRYLLMDSHVRSPIPRTRRVSGIKGAQEELFKLTNKIIKAKNTEEVNRFTQKAWNILSFGTEQTLSFLGDDAFYFWIIWSGVLFSEGMAATNDKVNAHIETLMAPIFVTLFRILQIHDYFKDNKAGKHTVQHEEARKIKAKQSLIAEKIQTFFLIKRSTENDIEKFAAMKLKATDLVTANDLEQAISMNKQSLLRYDDTSTIRSTKSAKPKRTMHSQYDISLPHLSFRATAAGISAYVLIEFIAWYLTTFIWLAAKYWAHDNDLADRTGIENANQTAADITFYISLFSFWLAFTWQGYANFQEQKTLQITADAKLSEKYPGHTQTKGKLLDELKATLTAELESIEELIKENYALVKQYNHFTTDKKIQANQYIPSFRRIKARLYSLSGYFAEQTTAEKITDFFTSQNLSNDLPNFSAHFYQSTIWEKIDDYIVTRLIGNAGTGFFLFRSEDYNWQDISGEVKPYDFWKATTIGVATIALRWVDKWFESNFETKKTLIEDNLDTYKYFLEKQQSKLDILKAVLIHNKTMLTAAVQTLKPNNENLPLLNNTI